jgi:uncharacterized coiled-coil protein SlyX
MIGYTNDDHIAMLNRLVLAQTKNLTTMAAYVADDRRDIQGLKKEVTELTSRVCQLERRFFMEDN